MIYHDQRDDVQGLRAVAVALVVAFHLWPSLVPGGFVGVDVFFVISGFLITRSLLATPPRGAGDVVAFWERRVRRLLPAAFLVLVVTLFATHFLAPATDWVRTAKEAIAAALYVENWHLVQQSADYLSAEIAPTPVQHYWTLSVEEQFYLVWPVLLIGTALLAGRRYGARSVTRVVIAVVLLLSLWHSVAATASDPDAAYFLTTTRVWELAAGGLLATWVAPTGFPAMRAAVSWVGLALVGASAFVFSTATPWPGHHAVLPVLGAVLFIWGASDARWGPGLVLGWRSVQWTGDASYSIYLWHWPLLVLAPAALGRSLNLSDTLVVLSLTLALSWLTHTYVENRWRVPNPSTSRRRPFQLAVVGALAVALVAGTQVVGVRLAERAVASTAGKVETDRCFGAASLALGEEVCPALDVSELAVPPTAAVADRAKAFDDGCMAGPPFTDARSCTYGTGAIDVALVGNSHAAHWLPALEDIAYRLDLRITTFLVAGCSPVDAPLAYSSPRNVEGCEQWRDDMMEATSGDAFDLVITSHRSTYPVQGHTLATTYEPWVDGMRSVLQQWADAGTDVLVIRDTPLPRRTVEDVPACVATHETDHDRCAGPRSEWLTDDPMVEAATDVPGVAVADLSDRICGTRTCGGVVGGVIAYFDGSHMTATFAHSLTPYLRPAVTAALTGGDDPV